MVRTAIQLYTLRDVDRPLPDLLDRVGETSFDGVEFAHRLRDPDTDLDAVVAALDRTGLDPLSAHVGLDALETAYDDIVAAYDRIGCDTLVVPWLDPEHFASADAVAEAAERVNDVAADLAADGFELHYHNHDQEFVTLDDGSLAMDAFLARTDDRVGFEIDLGWVAVGGTDPAAFVDRHADRIDLVHFSDALVDTREPTELGEGDLDVDAALEAVRVAGAERYVYENDDPADPLASLDYGAETLDGYR